MKKFIIILLIAFTMNVSAQVTKVFVVDTISYLHYNHDRNIYITAKKEATTLRLVITDNTALVLDETDGAPLLLKVNSSYLKPYGIEHRCINTEGAVTRIVENKNGNVFFFFADDNGAIRLHIKQLYTGRLEDYKLPNKS